MDKINTSTILHPTSYINLSKAIVGKRIPKNRFKFLMDEVESLVWLYKISKETCGINESEECKEYQIFEIVFKEKIVKEIIEKIQAAIPYPILFRIVCGNTKALTLYFNKFYLETDIDLFDDDTLKIEAKSIERLIFATIEIMTKVQSKEKESLEVFLNRLQNIKVLEQEIASLTRERNKEKQPNKRIELNELIAKKTTEMEEKR